MVFEKIMNNYESWVIVIQIYILKDVVSCNLQKINQGCLN